MSEHEAMQGGEFEASHAPSDQEIGDRLRDLGQTLSDQTPPELVDHVQELVTDFRADDVTPAHMVRVILDLEDDNSELPSNDDLADKVKQFAKVHGIQDPDEADEAFARWIRTGEID